MGPNDEPAAFGPKDPSGGRRAKSSNSAPGETPIADLIVFTLESRSGRLVSADSLDATGSRQALTEDQTRQLTEPLPTLQDLIEQAFEAGIDCVLVGEPGEMSAPEGSEDAQLSSWLLRSLIQHSAARPLTQPDILQHAILGTLLQQAAPANSQSH